MEFGTGGEPIYLTGVSLWGIDFLMYEVTIKRHFSAAHMLREIGGKCEMLHGHNFVVEVSASAPELGEDGLLIDFRKLKRWTEEAIGVLDHKCLNELEIFRKRNPSSEQIAAYVYRFIAEKAKSGPVRISRVTVWESEDARASYTEKTGNG
jgi:6-pyruvoyltetrahydropterin/6-carboxytetrahydropterin synthase